MSKSSKIILGIIVVVILVLSLIRPSTSVKSIKIGVINPMTGPAGTVGEQVVNAIKLASSTSLQVVVEDDQCDSKKALSAYMKLKQEGVRVFYISCSGSLLAVAPLAKADNNVILTAYAGSSEIRKTGDEVIRFIPDSLSIADAMSTYVSGLSSTTKLGLFYENQDYSKSVAMSLSSSLGNKIIAEDTYTATDNTFRTQIAILKAKGINTLLYTPTSDKALQLIYKEMQLLDYKPLIVGDVNTCEYSPSPKTFGLKAVCFDAGFSHETEAYKAFKIAYKEKYGVDSASPFYDSITYDIFKLLEKYSIRNSSDDFVVGLKKYLLAGVQGEMATYAFTSNGELLADDYLKMFEK